MARIIFHGPNNSNECRNFVRRLAREAGGRLSYRSFFRQRRGWFSEETTGKAAYSVVIGKNNLDNVGSATRKAVAGVVRQYRRDGAMPHGLRYSRHTSILDKR